MRIGLEAGDLPESDSGYGEALPTIVRQVLNSNGWREQMRDDLAD